MMKEYKRIAIDFNKREKCAFCSLTLSSCTGILLQETKTGEKISACNTCAVKNSINPKDIIPDLVKASYLLAPLDEEGQGKSRNAINTHSGSPTDEEAIAYLLLRQDRLKDIYGIRDMSLDEFYNRALTNTLTDENLYYLKHKMVKSSKELSLYWLHNLYACEVSIQLCLMKKQESVFLNTLREVLHIQKGLSEKQIMTMNDELEKAGFEHKISPLAFSV